MRYSFLLTIFTAVTFAQERPMLTWEGEVRGGATLFIQGNRVDMQGRETGSVDRPSFRFVEPLPAARQTVEVQVRRGRGRVEVVEQPTPRNDFAAVVDIRPPDSQPQFYRLQFFWDPAASANSQGSARVDDSSSTPRRDRDADGRGGGRRANSAAGSVTWSGQVDQEVIVSFQNRRASTTPIRGREVTGERADFTGPIPRSDVSVQVTEARGRGRVEMLEQPTRNNGYIAKVRIQDDASGVGDYSFTLAWDGDSYSDTSSGTSSGILTPGGISNPNTSSSYGGGNSILWSGRVDGTVRLTFEGDRVYPQRLSGAPISGERVSVGSPLPRNQGNIEVKKLRGRAKVKVIQQPSSGNGYRLIADIEDNDSGADDYEIEVRW